MMRIIQRLYDAIVARKKRDQVEAKLKALLYEAVPYYDSDYEGGWEADRIVTEILEICYGKK